MKTNELLYETEARITSESIDLIFRIISKRLEKVGFSSKLSPDNRFKLFKLGVYGIVDNKPNQLLFTLHGSMTRDIWILNFYAGKEPDGSYAADFETQHFAAGSEKDLVKHIDSFLSQD